MTTSDSKSAVLVFLHYARSPIIAHPHRVR